MDRRRERGRVAVFMAVVGVHVLGGLLLLWATQINEDRVRAAPDIQLTWVSLAEPRRPRDRNAAATPAPTTSNPTKNLSSRAPERQPATPESSNAISLPYVDWSAEAGEGAQRRTDDEEAEKHRRNLAGPSESQLEWAKKNARLAREQHEAGDQETAEGGELIAWISDKCYWTSHGATTYGLPQTGKVCKDPPKPETELFKDMRKELDARDAALER